MKFPAMALALILFAAGQGLGSDGAKSTEAKAAQNVYSVAMAARAAGYTGIWETAADLVRDMEKGVVLDYGGTPVHFKVEPMSETERAYALKHITIESHGPVLKP